MDNTWKYETMEKIEGCKVIRLRLSRCGEGFSLWIADNVVLSYGHTTREEAERNAHKVEKAFCDQL